jgi:hypothetical protein
VCAGQSVYLHLLGHHICPCAILSVIQFDSHKNPTRAATDTPHKIVSNMMQNAVSCTSTCITHQVLLQGLGTDGQVRHLGLHVIDHGPRTSELGRRPKLRRLHLLHLDA